MAKQVNKPRNTAPKRRVVRRKKKQGSDKTIFIGAGLAALLLLLVVVSVASLKSDKTQSKPEKVAVTENIAKKTENKTENKTEEKVDNSVVAKEETDIASIIRLVLFDYEISRTSIEERVRNPESKDTVYYFNVKAHNDTIKNVTEALKSVLTKHGYKLNITENKISAKSEKNSVQVSFVSTDKPVVTSNGNKKTKKPVEKDKAVAVLPTPPEPSDKVVKMAILLDDGGSNYALAERFVKLKYPVGIAILPHLQYSKEVAQLVYSYRKTLFLHFPMQPQSYPSTDPGKGAVLISMPEILIAGVTKDNFESLGVPIDGFNNHMGSAVTEDAVKMAQVMSASKTFTDTFIDSRTTAKSAAYSECLKAGLRCGENKRFIDNDDDVNAIIAKLYEAAELAKKNGEVLVIGHIRAKTLDALEIALPILESRKIAIVPIKTMVR